MTFNDLVEAMEQRNPKGVYSVTVEFSQSSQYQSCPHTPAVKRELEYKLWDGKKYHVGETPIKAWEAYLDAVTEAAPFKASDLASVNPHDVKLETF